MQANAGTEEEQLQVNAGADEELTANRPVETSETNTGNRLEPGMEEEQDETRRGGEEAPVQQDQVEADEPEQQTIQPEIGGETGKEQETGEAPLDTCVPCVGRSKAEGQVGRQNRIYIES